MSATLVETAIREEWGVVQESLRVDRTKSIIHGAKLVGLDSRNRRKYPPATLKIAAPLYEGAKINNNHPTGSPTQARDYADRLGNVIKGTVAFREGAGLFADVLVNPKHPISEQLLWDAENNPGNVALSHNILGKIKYQNDFSVVEAITRVISVDVVGDPGSTNGLFESFEDFEAMKTINKTLRALLTESRPSMVPAFEAIIVANGLQAQLDAQHAVSEAAKPDEQLISVFESLTLQAIRESSPQRVARVNVLGMLCDDVRSNAAPVAEKYKVDGSAGGGAKTSADGAPPTGDLNAVVESLGKVLTRLGTIETKLSKVDQRELAENVIAEEGVKSTPALVAKLAAMNSREAMKLHLLENSRPERGDEGELLERRNSGGNGAYEPPTTAKDFAARISR